MKAPTDVGSKGIVLRRNQSPESSWVNVDMSKTRRNRKHLFLLDSVDENTSFEDSDGCLLLYSYSSKEGHSKIVEKANDLSESQEYMIPELEITEQGEETPGVAEHVEETTDISEHEGNPCCWKWSFPENSNDPLRRKSISKLLPVSTEPVVTSSGQVSNAPLKYGMEYYK